MAWPLYTCACTQGQQPRDAAFMLDIITTLAKGWAADPRKSLYEREKWEQVWAAGVMCNANLAHGFHKYVVTVDPNNPANLVATAQDDPGRCHGVCNAFDLITQPNPNIDAVITELDHMG